MRVPLAGVPNQYRQYRGNAQQNPCDDIRAPFFFYWIRQLSLNHENETCSSWKKPPHLENSVSGCAGAGVGTAYPPLCRVTLCQQHARQYEGLLWSYYRY